MATRGWKQWSEAEARAALAGWRRSGKPLATYAREQGFSDQRLRWWRDRVGALPKRARVAAPAVLAPVRVVVREEAALEVALRSGQVVRVRRGFAADVLVDVVRALEGAC